MKLINIGFGNLVSAGRVVAVLIMDSDHVVLSALQPETVASRAAGQAEGKTVTEEEQ